MSIELTVLISAVSVAFAVYFGIKSTRRADTKDIEEQTKNRAELNMKLDFISKQTNEIKEQISSLVKEVQNHGVKIAELEQSTRSAHHGLDTLERRINEKEAADNERKD